jgi:hypothetical protein
VLLVVEPEHHDALETSPDFATLAEPRCRAERPRRRVSTATAALVCFAASHASRRCHPRFKPSPGTRARAHRRVPPPLAAGHRRPPPLSARMRPAPPDRDPVHRIQSNRPRRLLTVKIRQPSHEFTFGVGMSFIPYPLVLTPVV